MHETELTHLKMFLSLQLEQGLGPEETLLDYLDVKDPYGQQLATEMRSFLGNYPADADLFLAARSLVNVAPMGSSDYRRLLTETLELIDDLGRRTRTPSSSQ